MERKKYSREFKVEAVNLVRERGVSILQRQYKIFCGRGIFQASQQFHSTIKLTTLKSTAKTGGAMAKV